MAQLYSAWLSARRIEPRTRRRGWPCRRRLGSAWLSLVQPGAAGLASAPSTWALPRPSHGQAWLILVQLGSAWLSALPRGPPGRAGAPGRSCGSLAQLGSAWFSLAQLGSAGLSLRAPPLGSAAAVTCAGLAQLGSALFSLAQLPPHRAQDAQARLAVPSAAWFSLAQPGSAWRSRLGQRAQHLGIASALTRPSLAHLGSAWFSLAQRSPRAPPGRAGAPGRICSSLAQLGSAWFSLAQIGSAWLSLRAPPLGSVSNATCTCLAQLGSA